MNALEYATQRQAEATAALTEAARAWLGAAAQLDALHAPSALHRPEHQVDRRTGECLSLQCVRAAQEPPAGEAAPGTCTCDAIDGDHDRPGCGIYVQAPAGNAAPCCAAPFWVDVEAPWEDGTTPQVCLRCSATRTMDHASGLVLTAGNAAPGPVPPRTLHDGTEEEHTTHSHWGTLCMLPGWEQHRPTT